MATQSPKETLPIAVVFTNLFRNLPRMMLTNLLFAVPLAAFTALFWFIGSLLSLSDLKMNLVVLLAVIPVFPFYAGVVKVTVKMAAGEEKTPVCGNYFSAVRDNFLPFLFHGAVFYLAVVFSYVSFNLYLGLIGVSVLFMGTLIITILIMLLLLFMFFYIPAMTVSFDIPLRYIYKNSFLMSYGELKKNFTALLGLFFLFVVSTTFLIACQGSPLAVVIVTAVLAGVFVPAIAAFIVHSATYRQMYRMITDKSAQVQAVNDKIDAKRGERQREREQENEAFLQSVRDFELDASLPDDEYVYFNGRMVKKSVIKKLKAEAQGNGDDRNVD